jgi:group II intron reverse transcriptase/maturase
MKEPNEKMMESILSSENLSEAYRKVKANRGSAGIDGMSVNELGPHLQKHWERLCEKIEQGTYKPSPVKSVSIPKSNGGKRQLGIPTVLDRTVQQAMLQEISPIYEKHFSDSSYGYRPNRSAHEAVKAMQTYVKQGNNCIIDIDIVGFFDNINHDILMRMVSEKVKDKRVLRLIGKYLRAGKLVDGRRKKSYKGTPQGGPLSPLLGNIYLDALDQELENRGLNFCRYADDIVICVSSPRSAERILRSITKWIAKYLRLEISAEKSGMRLPHEGNFLGFNLREETNEIQLSKKSITKLKAKVRKHWDARDPTPIRERRDRWLRFIRGWTNYFSLAECKWGYLDLEGWMRRHMRKYIWQKWHNWKGRRNALKRLGYRGDALKIAHSSKGAWKIALALNWHISNTMLFDYGFKVPSQLEA